MGEGDAGPGAKACFRAGTRRPVRQGLSKRKGNIRALHGVRRERGRRVGERQWRDDEVRCEREELGSKAGDHTKALSERDTGL